MSGRAPIVAEKEKKVVVGIVTGPHGVAVVNLQGSGKLELQDLLKHHSLLLPPH